MVAFLVQALALAASSAPELQELFISGEASAASTPWVAPGTPLIYRIPALLLSKDGTTLIAQASERMGSSNDESATNLVQRSSTDQGKTWGPLTLVVKSSLQVDGHSGMSSAPWSLVDDTTGEMFLFYNANSTGGQKCTCGVAAVSSNDNGKTWSPPVSSGLVGSSLTTGITLVIGAHAGRLVTCMRKICKNSCSPPYHSYSAYSDDNGKTWHASHFLAAGTTECQVAELSDGTVYMTSRPLSYNHTNSRLFATSKDGGASWGPVQIEPALTASGGCAGSIVLNPTAGGAAAKTAYFSHPDAPGRTNMTVYVSRDDAATWAPMVNVYSGGSAYSSLALLGGGKLGLFFEKDGYKSLAFASLATA